MKVLVVLQTSGSGDEHFSNIALFTTEEKAEVFKEKLIRHHNLHEDQCYIWDHIPLVVDPINIEDLTGDEV